jgi:antitoxin MazE
MVARIKKWGNSLALRIPKELASEAGLDDNSIVEVKVRNGQLVVSRPIRPVPTLDDLLEQVTPENRHEETDFGPDQGKEVW